MSTHPLSSTSQLSPGPSSIRCGVRVNTHSPYTPTPFPPMHPRVVLTCRRIPWAPPHSSLQVPAPSAVESGLTPAPPTHPHPSRPHPRVVLTCRRIPWTPPHSSLRVPAPSSVGSEWIQVSEALVLVDCPARRHCVSPGIDRYGLQDIHDSRKDYLFCHFLKKISTEETTSVCLSLHICVLTVKQLIYLHVWNFFLASQRKLSFSTVDLIAN